MEFGLRARQEQRLKQLADRQALLLKGQALMQVDALPDELQELHVKDIFTALNVPEDEQKAYLKFRHRSKEEFNQFVSDMIVNNPDLTENSLRTMFRDVPRSQRARLMIEFQRERKEQRLGDVFFGRTWPSGMPRVGPIGEEDITVGSSAQAPGEMPSTQPQPGQSPGMPQLSAQIFAKDRQIETKQRKLAEYQDRYSFIPGGSKLEAQANRSMDNLREEIKMLQADRDRLVDLRGTETKRQEDLAKEARGEEKDVRLIRERGKQERITKATPGAEPRPNPQQAAHQIMQEARQQVEAQFKGPLGQIDMSSLGKTPEERGRRFQGMINERARELATERGQPNLFRNPNIARGAAPNHQLLEKLRAGEIRSDSQAVSFLLSIGVPAERAQHIAKGVIGVFERERK
jgi:hypothetical protein